LASEAIFEAGNKSLTAAHAAQPIHWWLRARTLWERLLRLARRPQRRLRLCESLPLGERRFVAVVEFEQERFLVGGTSASLILLAHLDNSAGVTPTPGQGKPAADQTAETPREDPR